MNAEKLDALANLVQMLNHKGTNLFISTSLIVTGQVAKESAKDSESIVKHAGKEIEKASEYANLADFGWLGIGAPTWLQIIGGVWIILQILNFCGVFRGISWAYKKLKGGE